MPRPWPDDVRTCLPSFAAGLRTAWLPDAFGAADLLAGLADGTAFASADAAAALVAEAPLNHLAVPVGRGTRTVPLLTPEANAALHVLTENALRDHRPHPCVAGATGADWDYRRAYRARSAKLAALAADRRRPLLQHLDVEDFARSVRPGPLLAAPWPTRPLATALAALHRRSGQCLTHGTGWSTRLGTALLAPVDEVVAAHSGDNWTRWSDGWHVAVRDAREAAELRAAVGGALAAMGLRLSERKSVLLERTAARQVSADVADTPHAVWALAARLDDVRRFRYALVRAAPAAEVSDALPDVVRRHPALLPRAAQYLDGAVGTPRAATAFAALADWAAGEPGDAHAAFRYGRLLAVAARHPAYARLLPVDAARRWARSPPDPLRELAERTAVTGHGAGAVPDPSPRVRAWLRRGAPVGDRQPMVVTYL